MGFFDWLFNGKSATQGNERLLAAVGGKWFAQELPSDAFAEQLFERMSGHATTSG